MRPVPFIFGLLLTVALPLAAQTKDEVIYPRGTAPAGAPAAPAADRTNTFLLLGTAAVAAAAGWWLWQKRRTSGVPGRVSRLSVVESRSLGSRQYLVVADYDGRKFLLGVCPGSIEMLTPLDGKEAPRP
ncbi:MAG: flagellar protein FliO/FliZ [Verrucomicrobiota bacterium]|nr:flagellar protein FliO/FliZ [Verrucomicrobiota bacterium]